MEGNDLHLPHQVLQPAKSPELLDRGLNEACRSSPAPQVGSVLRADLVAVVFLPLLTANRLPPTPDIGREGRPDHP